MRFPLVYVWAKRFHRMLVIPAAVLTGIMGMTGAYLHQEKFTLWFVDSLLVRYIHNKMSIMAGAVLMLMVLTGITLYILPLWRKNNTTPQV